MIGNRPWNRRQIRTIEVAYIDDGASQKLSLIGALIRRASLVAGKQY